MSRKSKKIRPPIHPGAILLEDFLKPLSISANKLARELRVPPNRIIKIVNGERGITADTALRLARFFNMTPDFWMNLQSHYDLERAQDEIAEAIERDVRPRAA
ncbi:MAG: HigA family addiction module antitoxin [Candidatus Binatia bacterium]